MSPFLLAKGGVAQNTKGEGASNYNTWCYYFLQKPIIHYIKSDLSNDILPKAPREVSGLSATYRQKKRSFIRRTVLVLISEGQSERRAHSTKRDSFFELKQMTLSDMQTRDMCSLSVTMGAVIYLTI